MQQIEPPADGEKKKRRVQLYPGFPELTRSDVSIHPSYSRFTLAYRVVCRHRYHWAKVEQGVQFMKELHSFERLQPFALGGIRVHREFSRGVFAHKIPPPRYMNKLSPDPLNVKQRTRLENIVGGKVNFNLK